MSFYLFDYIFVLLNNQSMKHLSLLSVFFYSLFFSQKIQVLDAESSKPIPQARIILSNQVLYTNDDGFAPVDAESKNFEISAAGFTKEKLSAFKPVVKLKPAVKEIDEVKIVSVDVKSIFEDLQRNYNKVYYSKPSLYDVTFKTKAFNNGQLYFMVIAESKLWTKSNSYNFKDGYKKKYDDIIQMQLNNVKYKKEIKSDSLFNSKTNEFSHSDVGDYFFSFEVYRALANMKMKESKSFGRLLSEEGDEQLIGMKIKSGNGIVIEGEFKYNKTDKAITYYSMNYQQAGYKPYKRTNTEGKDYEFQLGDVVITYEFYKKDGSYLPSLRKTSGDHFYLIHDGKKDRRSSVSEIVYNTFEESNRKGLDNKMDLNKSVWENIPVKEDKEASMLLSKEEQEFVNGK